jgi:hypothetical protein
VTTGLYCVSAAHHIPLRDVVDTEEEEEEEEDFAFIKEEETFISHPVYTHV